MVSNGFFNQSQSLTKGLNDKQKTLAAVIKSPDQAILSTKLRIQKEIKMYKYWPNLL